MAGFARGPDGWGRGAVSYHSSFYARGAETRARDRRFKPGFPWTRRTPSTAESTTSDAMARGRGASGDLQ